MKKILTAILIASILSTTLVLSSSASGFGTGVETVAEEVKLIKSGLFGRKITFSDADFKQGLCINDFKSVKITKLPDSSQGTLMLAGRRVGEGTSIKRKNLPTLVFIPASQEVSEASFKFTIDEYASSSEIEFVLKFTDKVNYEPKINDEYKESLAIKTQREIGVHGRMNAEDPEGDLLEYIIVSYPENGTLSLGTKESGEYVYTPYDSYTGSDSFVYVVRDEWGNFSKTQKVSISVKERMSEVKYVDMQNRSEYNAAVVMTAMGIMGGKIIGDGVYFNPDETVTRAEFAAMSLKALGIKADSTMTSTYFDDNSDIPAPLLGYVATAQKIGAVSGSFINGELVFRPNDPITKYEAAEIMSRLIGGASESETPVFADEAEIPKWARDSVYAMCSAGIFDYSGGEINADALVTRADSARYLYKLIEK